jgi:hypothetical protein
VSIRDLVPEAVKRLSEASMDGLFVSESVATGVRLSDTDIELERIAEGLSVLCVRAQLIEALWSDKDTVHVLRDGVCSSVSVRVNTGVGVLGAIVGTGVGTGVGAIVVVVVAFVVEVVVVVVGQMPPTIPVLFPEHKSPNAVTNVVLATAALLIAKQPTASRLFPVRSTGTLS